ncbi:MAG: hypothetical protein FWE07_02505 [Turicibacter sp.]|nr:hypothetical protein [Turicibacter sp.]
MYLDPAFAGMLLQILLALVVVGGVALFSMRRKIRELFSKKKDQAIYNNSGNASDVEEDVIDTLD